MALHKCTLHIAHWTPPPANSGKGGNVNFAFRATSSHQIYFHDNGEQRNNEAVTTKWRSAVFKMAKLSDCWIGSVSREKQEAHFVFIRRNKNRYIMRRLKKRSGILGKGLLWWSAFSTSVLTILLCYFWFYNKTFFYKTVIMQRHLKNKEIMLWHNNYFQLSSLFSYISLQISQIS